ncbi:MAG TPA: ABC transporter substrate-binding protein [Bosea sp. (in: a-proteobacteria)]|uniref:ABC transporter substrate-binding protein n=1 Tax=Bosea sp. (in: a-proteobacteria) TaxID=1871050 RepID=UPI002E1203E5|nr:ABC transporter substrate-binding protein [Bosea sp. (in: a-proteobacteria)]
MRSRVFTLAAAAALSGLAFASPASSQGQPQYGGQLIYAQSGEKFTLFMGRNTDQSAQDVWLHACETLVDMDEKNDIKPLLAKSWKTSPDGKKVTFTLQEGVKFHDGTPFNAEAAAFVFNEAKAKKFLYISLLEGFEQATADSEYEMSFHLSAPFAALLPTLGYRPLCVFSPTAYKTLGEAGLATKVVGTGPFVHTQYVKGEYTLFERNKDYWQKGKPYFDSVKIIIVPDAATRTAMLERGEIDRTVQLGDLELARLERNKNILVRTVPSTRQFYVVLNHRNAPLDNPKFRLALNYAIDKAGIVQSVFAGRGAALMTAPTVTEGVFGYADMRKPGEETIFPYDTTKAKALFKEAGYDFSGGQLKDASGKQVRFKFFTPRGATKGDYQTAQLIQTFLGQVGIGVDMTVMESAAFSSAMNQAPENAKYDFGMMSWGIPTADPDQPMMYFTHTKAWKPVGANRMFFSDTEIDRLADLAHVETDEAKRKDLVKQWMTRLLDTAPVIYLPTLNLGLAGRSYLKGDQILAVDNYPAIFGWFDKAEMERQGVKR